MKWQDSNYLEHFSVWRGESFNFHKVFVIIFFLKFLLNPDTFFLYTAQLYFIVLSYFLIYPIIEIAEIEMLILRRTKISNSLFKITFFKARQWSIEWDTSENGREINYHCAPDRHYICISNRDDNTLFLMTKTYGISEDYAKHPRLNIIRKPPSVLH